MHGSSMLYNSYTWLYIVGYTWLVIHGYTSLYMVIARYKWL